MGQEVEVHFEGLEELQRELRRRFSPETLGRIVEHWATETKVRAIPYPPEGPWNQPGAYPARWYQRHFGPRWARVNGTVGGRNTSERMQQAWLAVRRDPLAWMVANRASYAPFVMGEEQAGFHAAHGWKKLSAIAQEAVSEIVAKLKEQLLGGA